MVEAQKIAADGKMIPQNLEAERSVLGALLLHADAVADVSFLQPEDFYLHRHQLIFGAVLSCYNTRNTTDPIAVEEDLSRKGVLQEAGGREILLDLMESVVSAAGVVYHAEIVREKSVLRRLLGTCHEIARMSYENQMEAKDLLDEAERQIMRSPASTSRARPSPSATCCSARSIASSGCASAMAASPGSAPTSTTSTT